MPLPDTDPWIRQAQIQVAADSPRWQHVFGRYDAASLGGAVLWSQLKALRANGFELHTNEHAAVVIGPEPYRPTVLSQLRYGTTSAVLSGGVGALKRLNQTLATRRRLASMFPQAPGTLHVAQRLGPLEEVARLLHRRGPLRVSTSRHLEVIALREAGLEVIGQEGVAHAFTTWLLG